MLGLPSARFAKFLLNVVTIVFFLSLSSVILFHCPIQGPQAFVIITAPAFLKISIILSLLAVSKTKIEPGLIINSAFNGIFLATACSNKLAALPKS